MTKELRTFRAAAGSTTLRSDGKTFAGIVAPFQSKTYIGPARRGFFEQIAPEAFDKALQDRDSDIVALVNHNMDLLLGRQGNDTLRLQKQDDGLHNEIDLPDTTVGRDLATSVRRGDIAGQSFSFEVRDGGEEWGLVPGGHAQLRTLRDVSVFDVGPVTMPAYGTSTASMRNLSPELEARVSPTAVGIGLRQAVSGASATVSAAIAAIGRRRSGEARGMLWIAAETLGAQSNKLAAIDPTTVSQLVGDGLEDSLRTAYEATMKAAEHPDGESVKFANDGISNVMDLIHERPAEPDPAPIRSAEFEAERRMFAHTAALYGMEVRDGAAYQPMAYHVDPDETVECPVCGKMNDTDAIYCDQCGAKLAGRTDVTVQ